MLQSKSKGKYRINRKENYSKQTAQIVNQDFADEQEAGLEWPFKYSYLYPIEIEHLWDKLGRRMSQVRCMSNKTDELFTELQREWDAIAQEQIQRLVESFSTAGWCCITWKTSESYSDDDKLVALTQRLLYFSQLAKSAWNPHWSKIPWKFQDKNYWLIKRFLVR